MIAPTNIIQANSVQIDKDFLILGVTLMLSILSFFLVRTYKTIDKLTVSMNELNSTLLVLKEKESNRDASCRFTHEVVTNRLNKHSEILDKHSEDIAELKGELKKS